MGKTPFSSYWIKNFEGLSPPRLNPHPDGTTISSWAMFNNNDCIWLPLSEGKVPNKNISFVRNVINGSYMVILFLKLKGTSNSIME